MTDEGSVAPPRHPRYGLAPSIAVAQDLFDKAGGAASADRLAHYLGYKSAANGSFLARLASARLFGLIEGPPKAIRPTNLAHSILHPDYESVAVRARIEAFELVPLYRAFLLEYEGKPLPPREGMLNALRGPKFGVPPKDAPTILDRLLDSADAAGLFDVVGGDRTKMIRAASGPVIIGTASSSPVVAPVATPAPQAAATSGNGPSRGKLLDGLWELLPPGDGWNEDELQDWLSMLTMALRVRYKVSAPRT